MYRVRDVVVTLILMTLAVQAANRTIQMGILLPFTGSLTIGQGISGAVPKAINKFNTDPSFAYLRNLNYSVNYTVVDCGCDEGVGLTAFANLYAAKNNPPIDIYIGKVVKLDLGDKL